MEINDVNEAVSAKKKRKKKVRLFKLAAMEALVDQVQFLKTRYEKMSVDAEEKLGYHYNETIHNILFNKYVKTNEKLMSRYMTIRKTVEIEQSRQKKDDKRLKKTDADAHPALAAEPAPVAEPVPAAETEEVMQLTEPAPAVTPTDPNEPLDTRVVATESMVADGSYATETPYFMFKGSIDAWQQDWNKKNKKSKNNMKVVKPNTKERTTMGEKVNTLNENESILNSIDMVESLFEEYFGVEAGPVNEDKLPDTVVQVNRIMKDNEKNSLGYYKAQQENPSVANGGEIEKEKEPTAVKYTPSEEQDEFVKINRGGNLMDRALRHQETPIEGETAERWKEQAGAEAFDAAEDKKKKQDEEQGQLAPAMRVKSVNESASILGKYTDYRNTARIVNFKPSEAKEVSELNEGMARLETKGLGNFSADGVAPIIESHNFYIDLKDEKVYKTSKAKQPLNESVSVNKSQFDKMQHLMSYSPSKYMKGK